MIPDSRVIALDEIRILSSSAKENLMRIASSSGVISPISVALTVFAMDIGSTPSTVAVVLLLSSAFIGILVMYISTSYSSTINHDSIQMISSGNDSIMTIERITALRVCLLENTLCLSFGMRMMWMIQLMLMISGTLTIAMVMM